MAEPVRRRRLPAIPQHRTTGVASDYIEAGFWLIKWGRNTAEVPARIWACEHEPGDSDNLLDTGPIWRAEIAGQEVDPYRVQHGRKVRAITAGQYAHRMAEREWLRRVFPDDPKANPRAPVELRKMAPPF